MKVIGFVGLPGSGKGEASKMARELGWTVVVMGDVIRQEAARRGLDQTDQNLGQIGNALREEEGPEAIARRTLEIARSTGKEMLVVDGLRSRAEADYFRSHAEEFYLIEIAAPSEIRLGWLERRGRPDDPKREPNGNESSNAAALTERECREKGWGLGEAMEMADFSIENSGSLEDLRQCVVKVLGKIERGSDRT